MVHLRRKAATCNHAIRGRTHERGDHLAVQRQVRGGGGGGPGMPGGLGGGGGGMSMDDIFDHFGDIFGSSFGGGGGFGRGSGGRRVRKGSNFDAVKAEFNIKDKNGNSFDLSPEKRRYFTRGQITTETAIHVSPLKDIYLTIGDQLEDGSWIVNVQINFLIRWIWFSACLMAFAGIVLVSTNRKSNI